MRRMWAFTIAGAFLAFGAVSAEAQMRIGAKGGVSFSNFSTDPDLETESATGFVGGGHVQIPVGTRGFSIQGELLYTRKGAEQVPFNSIEVDAKIDYIEIPVLVRIDLPAQAVAPFVYAGGFVGFEASCETEVSGSQEDSVDCEDRGFDTESTDFGVLFGGGVAFAAGPGDLFLEARYGLGLTDINPGEAVEAKNRSGAVMVGYSVSLDPRRR